MQILGVFLCHPTLTDDARLQIVRERCGSALIKEAFHKFHPAERRNP